MMSHLENICSLVPFRDMSTSPEEILAGLQFDFIKEKAASGESFVIVGRCADYVLKDMDCVASFFIVADNEAKVYSVLWKPSSYPNVMLKLRSNVMTVTEKHITRITLIWNGATVRTMI